jgi:hypothetical protein
METHEVVYYTIEDENGFIFEEFDTLKEAKRWLKRNQDEDMKYICGFKQIRDEEEDCLEEITIMEERI